MASTSNPLILTNDAGDKVQIYDPEHDIIDDYGRYSHASMDNRDSPKSFYVVYDKTDYGQSEGVATTATLVPSDPLSGASGPTINLSYSVASAQGFDLKSPGIILFEHPNYIGNAKQFTSSKRDLRPYFPPGDNWSGVSSIIVTGGKWRLWGGRNFKPPQINGDLEKGCYSFKGRDKVQSIERLVD